MRAILVLVLFASCVAGCTPKIWRYLPENGPESIRDEHKIYVVNHGWHTGVIVSGQALNHQLTFLKREFSGARYYEIGWGDKGFYQANEITFSLVMKAIFWPSESVMHVVAMPTAPRVFFPDSEIVELSISTEGMTHLLAFVSGSFKRDHAGKVSRGGSGLYGVSAFYEGEGAYYMTNTCNSWVAKALDQAGVPIRTVFTLTADSVISQARNAAKKCCK